MKRRYFIQAAVAVALVWSAVAATTAAMNARIPSADRLLRKVSSKSLGGDRRGAELDAIATEYAQLPFLEKRTLRTAGNATTFNAFLSGLNAAEKSRFVERALPTGFRELLDGFSKMDPKDRQRNLERSRRELLENLGDSPARLMIEAAGPALLKQISEKGLGPFWDSLPPDTKLQLLPMIEQMQNNAQQLRD